MQILKNTLAVSLLALTLVAGVRAYASEPKEDYVHAPMPPGFQVVVSEVEGPVFADAQGHTLYMWPKKGLRAGNAGEDLGKPTCGDEVVRQSSGTQSPYPGGYEMPEIATRPACTAVWPPVLAAADAKPVGKWTILTGPGGRKQWAYERHALYTSVLDKQPGDDLGGTNLPGIGEGGAVRHPVGPESNVPGQFAVHTMMAGRLVTSRDGKSIYTYDRDGHNKSNCKDACLDEWTPVLAASSAAVVGEWTAFERTPGVLQWAFRGHPVYEHPTDLKKGAQDGSDVPGWHNVYTQMTPAPPPGFTMKPTIVGMGLGDSKGMTVYRYVCNDDGSDQLNCDYPESPQLYRFAMCGGGDPDLCVKTFPYVIAPAGAKTGNRMWGTMYIDPKTGKRTTANAPGALNVWTLRDRPIYTFAGYRNYGDRKPSDINGNGWGEGNAGHNGYMAIIYRDISENRDGNVGEGAGGR